MSSIWDHSDASGYTPGTDLAGYKVEASDGHIGKVSKHNQETGSAYLVVDTGVWIFGRSVLLPAGTVLRIDDAEETVYVGRTKDEIKDSPEFDADNHTGNAGYHEQVGGYYGNPAL